MVSQVMEFPGDSGAAQADSGDKLSHKEEVNPDTPPLPTPAHNEQARQTFEQGFAAPDEAGIIGAVDRVESNFVVGWASDLDHPESPVLVELLVDGAAIASCLAGQERPDVAAKKPGVSPYCGFRLAALHDLSQDISHVAVRVAGGPELPQRRSFRHGRKVRDGLHAGSVAQISGSAIWGWVNIDPEAVPYQPVEIEVSVDGERACTVQAVRKTLFAAFDSHTAKRGFLVNLAPSLFADGQSHLVSLRRTDGGELANSPIRLTAGDDFGQPQNASAIPDWIEPARPQIMMLGAELGYLAGHERSAAECGEQSRRTLEALWLFMRLARINPAEMLVRRDDGEQAWFVEEAQSFSRSHADVEAVLGPAIALDDMWLLGESALRVRSTAAAAGKELRLFQVDGEGRLTQIGRSSPGPDSLFCSAELLNPFLPVLGVILGEEETIAGCTVLPFPSLCRGGAHYSELRVEGEFPDYFAALRRMSRSLAQEYLGWKDAPAFTIGKLFIDLHEATGAERIFSEKFRNWLAEHFGLRVQAAEQELSVAPQAAEYLRNALHTGLADISSFQEGIAARERAGALTLTIPADAIPTLAGLVSRRLHLSNGADTQSGTYILADEASGSPRLLVSIPPLHTPLRSLEPANAPLAFPVLARSAPGPSAEPGERLNAPVLAIRFQAAWHANDSALLYPSAVSSPVFRRTLSTEEREGIFVSVLMRAGAGTARAEQLLRSIANQTIADRMEIVAVSEGGGPSSEELKQSLEENFRGRYRLVTDDSPPASQLNKAAASANGTHLLLVDDAIVLHDPRTVEALCLMAIQDRVATAGCLTVQEKPHGKSTTLSLGSAGFLPARVSFTNAPHLVFSELVTSAAMPTATYPVAGNAFRLALVRASAWKELGGLDATTFSHSSFDLDFGLRAIKAGYIHLCTSAIAAAYLGDSFSPDSADIVSLAYLPAHRWQSVFDSAAVIKELS